MLWSYKQRKDTLSLQVIAGSAWFISKRRASDWNLTQELNGVGDNLEEASEDDEDDN